MLNALGQILRDRRHELGISQADLAEIAGISVHTISDLESGKGNPRLSTLERVLEVLGLDLSVGTRALR